MDKIIVKNLNIFYKDTALVNDVSMNIQSGKITALLGLSGSGKSLIATAIMGYVANNLKLSGSICLGDNSKQNIACIMQNPRTAFNPLFSIKNCFYETLKARNLKIDNEYIKEILNKVKLNESVLNLYPHECSGGMLQRIMIALALVSRAKFIIADEPTSDLDLISQAAVLDILEEISSKIGILLITHDFGVVARLADYVYVMDNARIVEEATCIDIFKNPQANITKELINSHLSLYGVSNA